LMEWITAVDRQQRYALIIPCSAPLLEALAALPPDNVIRAKTLLAPGKALSPVGDGGLRADASLSTGELRTLLCLCVHGKLAWCSELSAALTYSVKGILEHMRWHGFACVTLRNTASGAWQLHQISARIDQALATNRIGEGRAIQLMRGLLR